MNKGHYLSTEKKSNTNRTLGKPDKYWFHSRKISGSQTTIYFCHGNQFISKYFAKYFKFVGIQYIRIYIAFQQDKSKIECYYRTIYEECLMKTSLFNLNDARKQISNYIYFYNTIRLNSSLNFLIPHCRIDFLFDRVEIKLKICEDIFLNAKKKLDLREEMLLKFLPYLSSLKFLFLLYQYIFINFNNINIYSGLISKIINKLYNLKLHVTDI